MKRCFCILIAIAMLAMLPAQAEETEITLNFAGDRWIAQMFAMDTFMKATIYEPTLPEEAVAEVMLNVVRLEKLLSATDSDSEISAVNASAGNAVAVSADTYEVVQTAVGVSEETGGAFDITSYSLVRAWGFTQSEYRVPDTDELEKLVETVDYSEIALIDGTISLPDGMKIDLGGIAKGYTGDVLTAALREKGVDSALLSLGGNIAVIGSKPDGTGWKVGIRDPLNTSENVGYVLVEDMNVITSGGYERYFEDDDGNIWWHIIDPATGYPALNGLISVTVIGKNGAKCDALSTALFVMGPEKASAYLAGQSEVDAILICEDGSLLMTQGLRDRFTPLGRYVGREIHWIER